MEFVAAPRVPVFVLIACAVALAQDGGEIYRKRCAQCHEGGVERAPQIAAMKLLSPERVLAALTSGKMAEQGKTLTSGEKRAVALFVTGKSFGQEEQSSQGYCRDSGSPFEKPLSGPHWSGWGVDPANGRWQPAAMAGLTAAQVRRLKLKWALAFPGASRAPAQPAVAGRRVFVGSDSARVYSLDAATGCIHWIFKADTSVRTAVSIGPAGSGWAVYFGDQRAQAYAVSATTGAVIWKVKVGDHPAAVITGAPELYGGRLYVPLSSYEEVTGGNPKYECCKFRGSVTALDAATGSQVWKSYTIPDPPRPVRKNK